MAEIEGENAIPEPGPEIPPLAYFKPLVGQVFQVSEPGGRGGPTLGWRLVEASPLGGDGFALLFKSGGVEGNFMDGGSAQGTYHIGAPDGTVTQLFLVPVSAPGGGTGMEAIVNPLPAVGRQGGGA